MEEMVTHYGRTYTKKQWRQIEILMREHYPRMETEFRRKGLKLVSINGRTLVHGKYIK